MYTQRGKKKLQYNPVKATYYTGHIFVTVFFSSKAICVCGFYFFFFYDYFNTAYPL